MSRLPSCLPSRLPCLVCSRLEVDAHATPELVPLVGALFTMEQVQPGNVAEARGRAGWPFTLPAYVLSRRQDARSKHRR